MDILNEKIEGLVKKAEKSKMPYGILKKVYDRGMAAWKTGHRPGTTPQQWAFARVNSFITKSSGTWGKADKDLAKQVRGEEVERRKTASEMLGQVKEKLPKDADAGDYVKDFRKSDAPQFKGKSDKKKQKMAIAAYLDSKEEVDLDEALKFKYAVVDTSKNNEVVSMSSDEKDMKDSMRRKNKGSLKIVKLKRPVANDKMIGYPLKEENCPDCGEDPCKCKPLTEAVAQNDAFIVTGGPGDNAQKVIAVFKDKGNGLKDAKKARDDYDKKNNPTKPSHKARIYRQTRLSQSNNRLKPGEKIMYSTFGNKQQFTKLKEDIQESGHTDVASMKTQVQIATDALQKMNTELGKLSDEEDLPTWWTNKVATAVSKLDGMADYIDAKSDQGEKMNEDNITEEKVFVVRFEKEGMRFAVPFRKASMAYDGKKILAKSAGVSNLSVTQDVLKPGVKFSAENFGKIVKESRMGEYFLDMQMDAQDMKERDFINKYKGEMGMNANELKRMYKEFNEEVVKEARYEIEFDSNEYGQDDEDDYIDEIESELKGMRIRAKVSSGSKDNTISFDTNVPKTKMIKILKGDIGLFVKESVEEVDNSLMAQATRVISQTSIKEKIDPADVDNIATADDRKAADKNIIIQLRRAQDMQGKADVTFKDKPNKKEKIDIKVINKALDMFDKMRPNDKTKMQTMIGKSYRDLLKTVQRGRI